MKPLLLLLFIYLLPGVALPQNVYSQGFSPWCLIRDEIEICNYNSEQGCYDVAAANGGYCRENSRRVGPDGNLEWCVVSASGRRCIYYGQEQCLREAMRIGGGCVYNTELALQKSAERKDLAALITVDQLEEGGQNQLADQLQEAAAESRAQEEAAAAAP